MKYINNVNSGRLWMVELKILFIIFFKYLYFSNVSKNEDNYNSSNFPLSPCPAGTI